MGDVKLIIIDTLFRALSGGNENSPDDMCNLVKHTDKVRHTLKAHLCVIHHSGKDRAKGARGHSLLRAATDTELEVVGHVIRPKKQRDMTEGGNIGFELHTINRGKNVHEKMIATCVMMEIGLPAEDVFDDLLNLTNREQIFMEVMEVNEDENNSIKLKE